MKRTCAIILGFLTILFAWSSLRAQAVIGNVHSGVAKNDSETNRRRGLNMLDGVEDILKTYYYDKKYRGIDIQKRFDEAKEKIKTLDTNGDIFRTIAGLVLEFKDSHTRFFPPTHANRVEYGFTTQVIGTRGYVTDVVKGSDADKKGLRPGDIITMIGQYPVRRDTLWVLNYLIYRLQQLPVLPVTVIGKDGVERTVEVESTFKTFEARLQEVRKQRNEKQENPYKCRAISKETMACKLKTFSIEKKFISQMMKEVSTAAPASLILDLRGNRGGRMRTHEYLVGHFFDRKVKVAQVTLRNDTEDWFAKPIKDHQFKGSLIVLVDSNSASASELFARIIQIENRGKVVGDVTAGAVMVSYQIGRANSFGNSFSTYAMNVTIGDVIMPDGKRLENIGVSPDYRVGPTSEGLALRTDPVLAYASSLLGTNLTPQDAAKLEFLYKHTEADADADEKDNGDDKDIDKDPWDY